MKRSRLEDLGRIYERLQALVDREIFFLDHQRCKDYAEYMSQKSDDEKYDKFHSLGYGLISLQDELHEIMSIAAGNDTLNDAGNEDSNGV